MEEKINKLKRDFSLDSKLHALVKGKRVALVGPSGHILGKGLGNMLDDYDVICRVKDVFPRGHDVDCGSRTDIVFYGCGTLYLDNFWTKNSDFIRHGFIEVNFWVFGKINAMNRYISFLSTLIKDIIDLRAERIAIGVSMRLSIVVAFKKV